MARKPDDLIDQILLSSYDLIMSDEGESDEI